MDVKGSDRSSDSVLMIPAPQGVSFTNKSIVCRINEKTVCSEMNAKKIANKIVSTAVFFLFLSICCFVLIKMAPGDTVRNMLGVDSGSITMEQLEQIRTQLGLNQPLYIQYWLWLQKAVQLDFGNSYISQRPVVLEILRSLESTLVLSAGSLLVMVLVSLPLSIFAAVYRDSWFDRAVTGFCMTFTSIPTFWLCLLMLQFFSVELHLFPTIGDIGNPISMVLPCLTLGVNMAPQYINLLRQNLLESKEKDFVRSARARGIPEYRIFILHILRDSMIPVLTVFGVSLGSLLGGAVITENIFTIPGIGKLAIDAIHSNDYTVLQGFLMVLGAMVFMVNNILDVLYGIINPAISLKEMEKR
jgi:peptide/nickel transport system permease protein